jgi:iron complex outermembrane receptor protein
MYIDRKKSCYLASAAIWLALSCTSALAQNNAGISNPDEIIVTARRIEERLKDVPISITVYNQEQMDDRNVANISDVADFTPSLSSNPRFGVENASFSIRGFTQDTFTAPSVAVYFADAVAPRGGSSFQSGEGAGPGSFFDLQNIQVLKGPQGTLFGRNTTGGAILLVPNRPKPEFEGYLMGSYGNYDMTRLQGVLNVPVGDGGLRIGFDRMKRDGYLKNIGIGPRRMADVDYIAARVSFLAPLTSNLENYSIFTFVESDTVGGNSRTTDCDPTIVLGNLPGGLLACDLKARTDATGDFYAVENSLENPQSYMRQWQFINTTTWDVSDNLTIKNIVSYGEIINDVQQDVLGTSWRIRADDPVAGVGGTNGNFTGRTISLARAQSAPGLHINNQSTFTEELQFQGRSLDGKLKWILGGYYELSKTLAPFVGSSSATFMFCDDIRNLVCTSPYGATGSVSRSIRNSTFEGFGLFSQATYDITDKLGITGGIRYTQDRSEATDLQHTIRFIPRPGGVILVSTTCTSVDTVLPDCAAFTKQKSDAPTWLINLDYKPNQDMLFYAKYARGYKQGFVNPRANFPFKSFGPEKVDTYEAGAKISWRGETPGFANFAAFYNDFSTQQFLVSWSDLVGRTTSAIVNTASSRGYGFELDAGATFFERLRLSGAVAYLNTKLRSVDVPDMGPPGFPIPIETAASGEPTPLAPKWKGTLSATYMLPVPESVGEMSAGVSWHYTGSYFSSNRDASRVDSFDTVNLNLNWNNIGGEPVDLGLFVNNLTNEKYFVFATDLISRGFIAKITGQPRMYGAQLKVRFGASAR